MNHKTTRRLAAIMFTDIVGYTALMQKNEANAAAVRTRHRTIFNQYHQNYNGEILQYFGDGTLSIFQSSVAAVECAIAIQKDLQQGEKVPLRIGLHIGEIVFDGTEIYGDSVNLTSRIESMGVAGAVLLSGKVNEELKNHPEIGTASLGHFELKNIDRPVEIFAVTNSEITIPERSALKGKQTIQNKSIAVLPFINMSASTENEYFSDGITEEIINALSKIKNLKVTSRTSSFFFKNKKIPLTEIGNQLKVANILEGSVRLSNNKVRITAQLINVQEDSHFWSETFDRSLEDIFAVQDEISLLIAEKLREHIGHFEIADQLVPNQNIPVEIYKQYLKGKYFIQKLNLPDVKKAIAIFEELIIKQPDFALPYLGIHQGYAFFGAFGVLPAQEAFAKGKPYLDKAIALDENLPECQYNLAGISFWRDWDLEKVYQQMHKALEIRPGYADAYQTLAPTLAIEGKYDAALNCIEKALQLDPFAAMNMHLKGLVYYFQEKYEEAILYFDKCLVLEPHFILASMIKGTALLLKGDITKAKRVFQSLPTDKLGNLIKIGGMALVYIKEGEIAKAEAGITKLKGSLQTDLIDRAMSLLIFCYTTLERYEEAMQLIEQGMKYRLPFMLMLEAEPLLKPLKTIPRFREIMQEVIGKKNTAEFPKKKYKNSSLKPEDAEIYAQKLAQYIQKEEPYLQSDLTLRQLAEMIGIHPNNLSQLLNEKIGKNFSEYINALRLEAFKKNAENPANQHLTILALAYESGFNSKTVFNTFFKKMMGITPKAYWKTIQKS